MVERQILTVARWTARIIGTLLILLIAIFAIGEGVPNPFILSQRENLLSIALLTMIVGQIAAALALTVISPLPSRPVHQKGATPCCRSGAILRRGL